MLQQQCCTNKSAYNGEPVSGSVTTQPPGDTVGSLTPAHHVETTDNMAHIGSADGPRSQAPLYLYARCPIADRAEGTFGLLRYRLGGDRPSQTAHLALFPARIHGSGLELKHNKAGVSASTQEVPEYSLHSLPATLRMLGLSPILSYS